MKHFIFLAMLLVATTLVFTACYDDGGKTYAIGDTGPSGVGIVFYVTDGGLHGLEAAPIDQNPSSWSNLYSLVGTTKTAIGTGSANTDAIIGQSGHVTSAAQICRDYRKDEEGYWFLPSKDELDLMYKNLHLAGLGGFEAAVGTFYWSSSEVTDGAAWYQRFDNGTQDVTDKSYIRLVRAVRAF